MDFDPLAAVNVTDLPEKKFDEQAQKGCTTEGQAQSSTTDASYDIWGVLSSVASKVATKSAEVAKICSEELQTFAGEVKLEASEIYREHLAAPVRQAKEFVPTLIPEGVKDIIHRHQLALATPAETIDLEKIELTAEFVVADHTKDESWDDFLTFDASRPPLCTEQKQVIVSNDDNIGNLQRQLVPSILSDQAFWQQWRYWRYCLAHPVARHSGSTEFSVIPSDPGDSHQSSKELNVNVEEKDGSEDWDSWE